ncbi:MAG TPA: hypothetical protein VKQ71_03670 [Acidimicrobiales bacterium]|nr:hypothetical protein [Acidimicrobiales bacterium]
MTALALAVMAADEFALRHGPMYATLEVEWRRHPDMGVLLVINELVTVRLLRHAVVAVDAGV